MKKKFNESIKSIIKLFDDIKFDKNFEYLCKKSINAINNNHKIIFLGNGGSASDAQHLATELTCKFKKKRRALPAIALTTDTSALTAIGNDYGFQHVFKREIEALANPNDVVIGISTSGNSGNVLDALKLANKLNCRTLGLSGRDGGEMNSVCEINIVIPAKDTPRIQEMHIFVGHTLCHLIEQKLS